MQVLHQLLYVMIGCAGRPVVQNMVCDMMAPCSGSLDRTPTYQKKWLLFINTHTPTPTTTHTSIYIVYVMSIVGVYILK
jgi:hypothetical protein